MNRSTRDRYRIRVSRRIRLAQAREHGHETWNPETYYPVTTRELPSARPAGAALPDIQAGTPRRYGVTPGYLPSDMRFNGNRSDRATP